MTNWKDGTYACVDGCEHRVVLGKLPLVLRIEHGVTNFKTPACLNPLIRLEPEITDAEIMAWTPDPEPRTGLPFGYLGPI